MAQYNVDHLVERTISEQLKILTLVNKRLEEESFIQIKKKKN